MDQYKARTGVGNIPSRTKGLSAGTYKCQSEVFGFSELFSGLGILEG